MLSVAMIGISARPADALLEGYINFGRMRKGAALIAQARPPVYMIAINEVSNQEVYAKSMFHRLRSPSKIMEGRT